MNKLDHHYKQMATFLQVYLETSNYDQGITRDLSLSKFIYNKKMLVCQMRLQ